MSHERFCQQLREVPAEVYASNTVAQLPDKLAWHMCVVGIDDVVKCWGWNNYGQLGHTSPSDTCPPPSGTVPCAKTPGTVSVGGTVKRLAVGFEHTCALLSDDTLKCWGGNTYGHVGTPSTDYRSSSDHWQAYLKNSISSPATVCAAGCVGYTTCPACPTTTELDYTAGSETNAGTKSALECEAACSADSTCEGWGFKPGDSNTCYLWGSIGSTITRSCDTAGTRAWGVGAVKTSVFDSKTTSEIDDCFYVKHAGACRASGGGSSNYDTHLYRSGTHTITEAECMAKCDALGPSKCNAWDYNGDASPIWCAVWSQAIATSDADSDWTRDTAGTASTQVCVGHSTAGPNNNCWIRPETAPCA